MSTPRPIRRRLRALSTPLGVLLASAVALPQALARSAERAEPAAGVDKDASRAARSAATAAAWGALQVPGTAATTARQGTPPLAHFRRVGTAQHAEGSRTLGRGQRVSSAHLFARVATKATRRLERAAARRLLPPLAVRRVIAAGNRIARARYSYGGGHGNWDSGGYDCSGSVSYALHGGGLLDTALASGGFMSWGEPGPGRWITIYANPGHAFMVVAGRRFDTTGREQTGSRWQHAMRDTSGYVARHPRGL